MNRSMVALFATLASLGVILALAVAGAMGGGRAPASHVACGDTITADTTLDSDLSDCPNHGIVIGADDITLDLNGHRIDGDGTPAPGCNPRKEFCDIGVFNKGHDGVTMRNGSVREFDAGVFVFKSRASRVLDISSKKNTSFGLIFNEVSHSRSATARQATTSLPRATASACSAPITSGSSTTRSRTTPGRASTSPSVPPTTT